MLSRCRVIRAKSVRRLTADADAKSGPYEHAVQCATEGCPTLRRRPLSIDRHLVPLPKLRWQAGTGDLGKHVADVLRGSAAQKERFSEAVLEIPVHVHASIRSPGNCTLSRYAGFIEGGTGTQPMRNCEGQGCEVRGPSRPVPRARHVDCRSPRRIFPAPWPKSCEAMIRAAGNESSRSFLKIYRDGFSRICAKNLTSMAGTCRRGPEMGSRN